MLKRVLCQNSYSSSSEWL